MYWKQLMSQPLGGVVVAVAVAVGPAGVAVRVGVAVAVGVFVRVGVFVAPPGVGVEVFGAALKLANLAPEAAGEASADGPHEFVPGLLSMPYGRRPVVLMTEPAQARA